MSIRLFSIACLVFAGIVCYGQSVKVMTYNIRYDTPADSINQWPGRTGKVVALIQKYDPDILGVQEALYHQVMDLVKALPQYDYIGVGRDDGKKKGEFSALLFKKDRFAVVDQNTFWLSETPDVPGSKDWDAAITRVASWGKLRDNTTNREFLAINTHFDHIGKTARAKSAVLLTRKAAEIGQHLPLIITGDFNCTRQEPPYAAIMEQHNVKLLDPAPKSPPGTFCTFKVNSIACTPIDYIFCSTQWKPSNYKVISDNDGMFYPSDHLPVMTTLLLKK